MARFVQREYFLRGNTDLAHYRSAQNLVLELALLYLGRAFALIK
jgi:hypothetical protein